MPRILSSLGFTSNIHIPAQLLVRPFRYCAIRTVVADQTVMLVRIVVNLINGCQITIVKLHELNRRQLHLEVEEEGGQLSDQTRHTLILAFMRSRFSLLGTTMMPFLTAQLSTT